MAQDTSPSINPQRQPTPAPRVYRPQPARRATSGLKTQLRRAFYHGWRVLPRRWQRLAVRIAAPKATTGACAIILDGQGRVLLAHHTYRGRAWGLPGGFVSTREQPAAGLARELHEELGVQAQVGQVLSAQTNKAAHQLTLYYRATLLGTPHEDGIEIDGFRYATPEEVSTLLGDDADICLRCMQGEGRAQGRT
jgi:ADP-ribose pyrophosphatase YjhB (NUDIX family)